MKCFACNYEYEADYKNMEIVVLKGDEEFNYLKGSFFINGSDYFRTPSEVTLYVCPKCGTVKIDI